MNDTNNNLFITFMLCVPITWGIYEFRQFRLEIKNINGKMDLIIKNRLNKFPLLKDIKNIIDKLNKALR